MLVIKTCKKAIKQQLVYTYKYPRPALTADVVLLDVQCREVLLIRRGHSPFKDCWALPGGFFDFADATIEAELALWVLSWRNSAPHRALAATHVDVR